MLCWVDTVFVIADIDQLNLYEGPSHNEIAANYMSASDDQMLIYEEMGI